VSREKYENLVRELCRAMEVNDPATVLQRGALEVAGYEVLLSHLPGDPNAMYMNFNFGIVSAGRTLRLFHQMLTSNLTLYAQDQAQLGVNPETGGMLLIVRIPMTDEVDGPWLADTFNHYSEHGRYWRQNRAEIPDEVHEQPAHAQFVWMRC
jgi:hypothetical protein